ncbi:hypothetical protein EUX98_g2925 [Antrodiella citrinella]|uniref:Fe2OG dioxygenase domain-containing protein n=1 Tax=Antrodiella citrinella TaxID=2447956 RepID=A0A4V3XJ11_9APHY|nr:hypothetical protein EUX98_g2925 [Antrodiella citrinella]
MPSSHPASSGHGRNTPKQYLGPGDRMGEGDTSLVLDILPAELASVAFENMRKEVAWNTMHHRGGEVPRLVAVEGEVDASDGSFPIYRHPADESPPLLPFSPTVALIQEHVESVLKHPVNHVLIQHYRSGADYISEHSDKTVDVVPGSYIVNVSIGAQRVMTLRTKKDVLGGVPHPDADDSSSVQEKRVVQRVPLPHNSMFVMGLQTNAKWMHSIRADKRVPTVKSAAEVFNNQERISLTFRNIGTFLSADQSHIHGQGAKGKTKKDARPIVLGGAEAEALIVAFGNENHQSDFDWQANYGEGFDVLHFNSTITSSQ